LPQELQARYVRVDGQVKAPGLYRVEDGETLRDAVRRAGGLMPHAYLYASELTRESVRLEQEQRLHELAERIGREALSPANRGGLSDKSDVGSSDLALRQAYLAKLNDIHPTGRIVLGLKPGGSTIDDVPKFRLQDGDHYFVPALPNTVDVLGNVYNQGAMRYVAGQHAGLYLDAAGGATRDGDRRREFILRADGTLVSRQQVARLERLEIYPGDAVIVPPQLRLRSNGAVWIGAAQILSSFALSSLAIRALE
jgi:protein involved in polysaccharide export with SLBB domain